jgi:hypothetical protein
VKLCWLLPRLFHPNAIDILPTVRNTFVASIRSEAYAVRALGGGLSANAVVEKRFEGINEGIDLEKLFTPRSGCLYLTAIGTYSVSAGSRGETVDKSYRLFGDNI